MSEIIVQFNEEIIKRQLIWKMWNKCNSKKSQKL